MRIAIQGQAGSFHEQAVKQWYGPEATIVPCVTFGDVFQTYARGQADAIVVAVENTIYGTINETYRHIESCSAPIVGEVTLTIQQTLITNPGTQLEDITSVYSHPVALSQCRHFLQEHLPNAAQIEYFDTAGAVEFIKQHGSPRLAAIAGEVAAQLHNMPILKRHIQDGQDNITRFLVLDPIATVADANRATPVVTTTHQPGSLLEILRTFANQSINLASLQSQPIIGQPWNYKFFITVDTAGPSLQRAIDKITSTGHKVTLLGEYQTAQ